MLPPDSHDTGVAAGYAYLNGEPFDASDVTTQEQRLPMELTFTSIISKSLIINHRLQLEERFIENLGFRSGLRYLQALNIHL
jgi:hypothetical protein